MQHKGSDADMSKNYRINLRSILQAGILVSGLLILSPAYAQSIIPDERDIVIETINGMILSGQVVATEKDIVSFKNQYGNLEIPLTQIYRIGGNLFDPQKGIIQEHSVQIQKDGKLSDTINYGSSPGKSAEGNLTASGKGSFVQGHGGNPFLYPMGKYAEPLHHSTAQPPAAGYQSLHSAGGWCQRAAGTYLYTYLLYSGLRSDLQSGDHARGELHIERVEPAPRRPSQTP